MKSIIALIFALCIPTLAQDIDVNQLYSDAMKEYRAKNYSKASEKFTVVRKARKFKLPEYALYNGACIYALNGEKKPALEILSFLVGKKFYSNFRHISSDTDLQSLHSLPEWKALLKKVKHNQETQPARNRGKIKSALLKARALLKADGGKLWGESLWHENVLFQDYQDTIYSLKKLKDSKTDDSVLYYKKLPKDTLSKTNTVQEYDGEKYATILADDFYMNDESATVIHELFHRLHFEKLDSKGIKLKADPVAYLDNYDARELLRLEYEGLRTALKSIDVKAPLTEINRAVSDALMFRKVRQNKYSKFLRLEVEIETVEGLAAYTGFALSTYPNKYKRAISGINGWEKSATYTRPFPYATGPAYGLIFDYLKLNWKTGFENVYDFLKIYESLHLKKSLEFTNSEFQMAKQRNNFASIHKEEIDRKALFEKRTAYYTDLLFNKPTLKATLVNNKFSLSFNMNGTLSMGKKGIVYSGAKGKALDDTNFGSFEIDSSKAKLGKTGILSSRKNDKTTYTFPLPVKIQGTKIIGEFYEIELNSGWNVRKVNAKGDLEIVQQDSTASNK